MGAGGPSGIGGAGDGASRVGLPSVPQPLVPTGDESATGRGKGAHAKASERASVPKPTPSRSSTPRVDAPHVDAPTSDGVRDGAKLDPRIKHETFKDPATGKTRHRVTYPPPPAGAQAAKGGAASSTAERGRIREELNVRAGTMAPDTLALVGAMCQMIMAMGGDGAACALRASGAIDQAFAGAARAPGPQR